MIPLDAAIVPKKLDLRASCAMGVDKSPHAATSLKLSPHIRSRNAWRVR
jgi:hypothetical protein